MKTTRNQHKGHTFYLAAIMASLASCQVHTTPDFFQDRRTVHCIQNTVCCYNNVLGGERPAYAEASLRELFGLAVKYGEPLYAATALRLLHDLRQQAVNPDPDGQAMLEVMAVLCCCSEGGRSQLGAGSLPVRDAVTVLEKNLRCPNPLVRQVAGTALIVLYESHPGQCCFPDANERSKKIRSGLCVDADGLWYIEQAGKENVETLKVGHATWGYVKRLLAHEPLAQMMRPHWERTSTGYDDTRPQAKGGTTTFLQSIPPYKTYPVMGASHNSLNGL